jgi:AAA domain
VNRIMQIADKLELKTSLNDQREFVKALWYGDGGTGKTTAMASLAHLGEVIYIDAEAGLKRLPLRNLGIPIENIRPIELTSTAEVSCFDFLEALWWRLKSEFEQGRGPVGVLFDSMTEIQKKLLDDIVRKASEKAEARGMERTVGAVQRDEWGQNTEQMRQLARKFRDLPCHVGFACLSRRDVDDDGSVTLGPALTPAFAADIYGYCDVVLATLPVEVIDKQEVYSARTRRQGKYQAKDRFGVLPARLPSPSFDRLIAYVQEEITRETDPALAVVREARAASRPPAPAPAPAA